MEQMTVEQEFQARVFLHQTSILGGYLMNDIINTEKAKSGIQLPDFILREEADKISNEVIQMAIKDGTFKALYEGAWDRIKADIPEHFKVM